MTDAILPIVGLILAAYPITMALWAFRELAGAE